MEKLRAIVACWWYCLIRTWTNPAPCMSRYYVTSVHGPRELHVVAAVTSDWKILRVFYESGPGVAVHAYAQMQDSVYI